MQQASDEDEGVLPGYQKVERGQDEDGMHQQAADHRDGVHAQLTAHGRDVVHLHNLTGDQEEDAHRCVPGRGGGGRGGSGMWLVSSSCQSVKGLYPSIQPLIIFHASFFSPLSVPYLHPHIYPSTHLHIHPFSHSHIYTSIHSSISLSIHPSKWMVETLLFKH